MQITIEAWKDHHDGWTEKSIRTLNDLYSYIHDGRIWHQEDEKYDEKIKITIEIED